MRTWTLLFPLSLALALVGAASPAPAGERVTIALSGAGTMDYVPLEVAHALGYLADEGLDADLQYFKSGTHAATALLAGGADFSGNAFDHAVKAALQGRSLKAIAAFNEVPGVQILVSTRYRDAVRDLRDLKGRPVAVTGLGAYSHMILSHVLARSGLAPGDVNAVPVGNEALAAALENDRVQGMMSAGVLGARLLETGRAFVLLDLRNRAASERLFGGPYLKSAVLARAEVVAERPETCARVARAVVRATRWLASRSSAEVAAQLPETLVQDRRVYAAALDENRDGFSRTGRVDPRAVETVLATYRSFGLIPEGRQIDPAALFDNRFVDRASASGS